MLTKIFKAIDGVEAKTKEDKITKCSVLMLLLKVFENEETYNRAMNALNEEFEEDIKRKRFEK